MPARMYAVLPVALQPPAPAIEQAREIPASRQARLTLPNCSARWMTCSRSPRAFSSRVIGPSSQSGPLHGVVTLGTIGQMALVVSSRKCQHSFGSGHTKLGEPGAQRPKAAITPRRTNVTPMAASTRLRTLMMALQPASPSPRPIDGAHQSATQTIARFSTKAATVIA